MAIVKYLLLLYDLSSVAINSSDYRVSEKIPVPVLSRAQICSHLIVGIAGSNRAERLHIRLLFVMWVAASATG